jgi:hypothetical protein
MNNHNHELIRRGLGLCTKGLRPFIEKEMRAVYGEDWERETRRALLTPPDVQLHWDSQAVLNVIDRRWNEVFRRKLERRHRSWAVETVALRHDLMHEKKQMFSDKETMRGLDTIEWLLAAIFAPECSEVAILKDTIGRKHSIRAEPPMPRKTPVVVTTSEKVRLREAGALDTDSKNMSAEERILVIRRVRGWASKPQLNVHRIIGIVVRSTHGLPRYELVNEVERITNSKNAYGAVASLLCSKSSAYGRALEDVSGIIRLHPAVEEEIRSFQWSL